MISNSVLNTKCPISLQMNAKKYRKLNINNLNREVSLKFDNFKTYMILLGYQL